jgi:hypothetical protein
MRYGSKVDLWLAVVLVVASVLPAGLGIYLHQLSLIAITAILLAILRLIVVPISYEIESDRLVIRHGVMKMSVLYSGILSMRPTRSALSSPALSLDRIEIRYAPSGIILISPEDRRAFLERMRIHAPQADISIL